MTCDATVGIIGAGPMGIELAIALKQAGISYLLFDKGQVAQMIYNFPPQTHFFSSSERISIAGIPIQTIDQQKCSREQYLAYIRSVVMTHQLKVNSYEEVTYVDRITQEGFALKTLSAKGGFEYRVRYLVLSTGGTSHPRLLNVPGENLAHVSTKMNDPHQYFQKQVLIVGGKNSAAESALRCFHAGADVTMCLRKEQFDPQDVKYWLLPELLGRISRDEIHCHYQSVVTEICQGFVRIKKNNSQTVEVQADFVIKAIGFEADMKLFHQLEIALSPEQQSPIIHEDTMETTVPGVFVLGTIIGGTQKKYRVFIENTHGHVLKIVNVLCAKLGLEPPKGWLTHMNEPSKRLEE